MITSLNTMPVENRIVEMCEYRNENLYMDISVRQPLNQAKKQRLKDSFKKQNQQHHQQEANNTQTEQNAKDKIRKKISQGHRAEETEKDSVTSGLPASTPAPPTYHRKISS